jgi:hypothetical protein
VFLAVGVRGGDVVGGGLRVRQALGAAAIADLGFDRNCELFSPDIGLDVCDFGGVPAFIAFKAAHGAYPQLTDFVLIDKWMK